jgi:hypothetical protein
MFAVLIGAQLVVPLVTMSRPRSMPDVSALLDTNTPLYEARAQNRRQTSPVRGQGHPRKKASISLAAGLMMNTEPKSATFDSPYKQSLDSTTEEEEKMSEGGLFHAYALKVSNSRTLRTATASELVKS